jgi:hypothetical protein
MKNNRQKSKPLWDYYYDKQLELLLKEYEFNFEAVADKFNMITESDNYTKKNCEERYTELYQERNNPQRKLEEDIMIMTEGKKKKTIYEMFEELPLERTAKNFLHVTEEDLANAFSVSAITGEVIKPTGSFSHDKSRIQYFER